MALSNLDRKPETRTGKSRRHRLFAEALRKVDSGGVDKRKKKKNFFFAIFQKKRKIIFKKAERKKKKAEFRRKAED